MSKNEVVAALLNDLLEVLQQANLWQLEEVEAEKLLSSAPFCCDTLRFEQWLQFVFLPKMDQLLCANAPLPKNIAIAPMAEIHFGSHRCFQKLHRVLSKIDSTLGGE